MTPKDYKDVTHTTKKWTTINKKKITKKNMPVLKKTFKVKVLSEDSLWVIAPLIAFATLLAINYVNCNLTVYYPKKNSFSVSCSSHADESNKGSEGLATKAQLMLEKQH